MKPLLELYKICEWHFFFFLVTAGGREGRNEEQGIEIWPPGHPHPSVEVHSSFHGKKSVALPSKLEPLDTLLANS